MTSFRVSSQNLNMRFHLLIEEINDYFEDCELNIACFQDTGEIGPEGPTSLSNSKNIQIVATNYSNTNKCRNVATLIGRGWNVIGDIYRNKTGSLLGITVQRERFTLGVLNAYLPPGLDNYGKPTGDFNSNTVAGRRQAEALRTYDEANTWLRQHRLWIMVGDLNETRDESWIDDRLHYRATHSIKSIGTPYFSKIQWRQKVIPHLFSEYILKGKSF